MNLEIIFKIGAHKTAFVNENVKSAFAKLFCQLINLLIALHFFILHL